MKIKAILEQKPTVSFEVFPPKQWDKIEGTKAVVKEMVKSHPAFMSVTYGAAGTTSGFTTATTGMSCTSTHTILRFFSVSVIT